MLTMSTFSLLHEKNNFASQFSIFYRKWPDTSACTCAHARCIQFVQREFSQLSVSHNRVCTKVPIPIVYRYANIGPMPIVYRYANIGPIPIIGQSLNEDSLVWVSSCSNTGSIRGDSYWTSRKNSLVLIKLSSINKVSLVLGSSCSNTGSIRDDPHWTSRKNDLELIELSSINKVILV